MGGERAVRGRVEDDAACLARSVESDVEGVDETLSRQPSRELRRRSWINLQERLRFETFLAELSAAFVSMPAGAITQHFDTWLTRLTDLVGVDRGTLLQFSSDGRSLFRRHTYSVPGIGPLPTPDDTRWIEAQLRRGRTIAWSRIPESIPRAACAERRFALRVGTKSLLVIPAIMDGSTVCALALSAIRAPHRWRADMIERLRLAAQVFASALLREQAASALQQSEQRSRALLKALPDMVFVMSAEGVYIDYNAGDASQLLMPPEQFLGRNMAEILPHEVAAQHLACFERLTTIGASAVIEFTLRIGADDRQYEARLVRREDWAVVCIVRDITDRVRAACQLSESEARFRSAFDDSAIGLALVSPEGRWLQVNTTLGRMLGYTADELRGLDCQRLSHPEDLSRTLALINEALSGPRSRFQVEKRYLRRDGQVVWVSLTASLVRDSGGAPLYFVWHVQDLTESRQAQLEIERLRLELAHVGRVSLVGQLTAALAHELGQPLTVNLSSAQAAAHLLEAGKLDCEEMRQILHDLVASNRRAAEVIKRLRGFLRKDDFQRSLVHVNPLVQDVARIMHSELVVRRVDLAVRLASHLPLVMADRVHLQQVILNLMLNAADAMHDRPPEQRKLMVTTRLIASSVEVAVHDRGMGIDLASIPRMFEPFFSTKPGGMGLGLTICSDIVREHGGRICAENNGEGGATFRVSLPAECPACH
jgi:PAS domain S-box-containing protein